MAYATDSIGIAAMPPVCDFARTDMVATPPTSSVSSIPQIHPHYNLIKTDVPDENGYYTFTVSGALYVATGVLPNLASLRIVQWTPSIAALYGPELLFYCLNSL